MASVLYYGQDDRIPKMLDQFFQGRLKEFGESNSIVHVKNEKNLEESLVGMTFEVIFFEASLIPGLPVEWLNTARKTRPNLPKNMILVGSENDPVKLMKLIEGGWTDYILMPPDKALLIEKVWMYAQGKRSSDLRQVFSMKMNSGGGMAKPAVFEELSEFDCKVRAFATVGANELMILFSAAFGADDKSTASVLGRCYKSEKHPSIEGAQLH